MHGQRSMRCGGTIRPSRFVKVSAAEDRSLLEADAGEFCIGISTEGTQDPPTDGASGNAGEAGDMMEWYGLGEECLLEIGSGGVTAGDRLASDADGKGVTAAAGTIYGAVAWEDGAEGEKILVLIVPGELDT